jgi:hypothetical protein
MFVVLKAAEAVVQGLDQKSAAIERCCKIRENVCESIVDTTFHPLGNLAECGPKGG